jgi:hypothetical protein
VAEPLLAAAGVLQRRQPEPGGKLTAGPKLPRIGYRASSTTRPAEQFGALALQLQVGTHRAFPKTELSKSNDEKHQSSWARSHPQYQTS